MKTDIEIMEEACVMPIKNIISKFGLSEDDIRLYGKYIAKIPLHSLYRFNDRKDGKLIVVTAITPTPAGEGKTVTTIGLIQGLGYLGKNVVGAIREPSIGPTFGIKGGATGGGYSQVYPMQDINLHFTGDIHAVSAAHNLLSQIVENELIRDNKLNIDPTRIVLKKVIDINSRELRNIITGLGNDKISGGIPHESGFIITSASEISAILALSTGYDDLRSRLERMIVAYTNDDKPVTVKDLKCVGSMLVLLKDAINPNLVQTLEGQPVFVHGFPFANIAHGSNSIIATKAALKLGDYVVTETGFASDLGGEKFMDIVCRQSGIRPDCVVIVASIKALMTHGGGLLSDKSTLTINALKKGFCNLDKHVDNMSKYGLPVIVSINHFEDDSIEELNLVKDHCKAINVEAVISDAFFKGGIGTLELAKSVLNILDKKRSDFRFIYEDKLSIKEKIGVVATKIYGADGVFYSTKANKDIHTIEVGGFGDLPVCIAKTQASLTDNPEIKGSPRGWMLNVIEVRISSGAGFVIPICGNITLMPGLPRTPAAIGMDILPNGKIVGLK